ncbi:hypothetical protein FHS34_003540 [Streptomyces echinatus]|uniref:EamA domain-containing protein n=1 Tax=Streptomyces echinatus TaxID=67293 RepID=A0A7W9PVL9_9ACTN|nr:hypothetical protein [Streptomyces echinatus]
MLHAVRVLRADAAVRRTSPSRVSLLLGTEPVWAAAVGIAVGGDRPGVPGLLGAVLVLAGTAWGRTTADRERGTTGAGADAGAVAGSRAGGGAVAGSGAGGGAVAGSGAGGGAVAGSGADGGAVAGSGADAGTYAGTGTDGETDAGAGAGGGVAAAPVRGS